MKLHDNVDARVSRKDDGEARGYIANVPDTELDEPAGERSEAEFALRPRPDVLPRNTIFDQRSH